MKTVRIVNNEIIEIIPSYAIPVEKWYGKSFTKECVEAPDEVEQYWKYDPETNKFSPPQPYNVEEQAPMEAQLKAVSDRQEFLEDCIAEMATQVYS